MLRSLSVLSKISNISGLAIFVSAVSIVVYYFIGLANGKQLCDGVTYGIELFPHKSAWEQIMLYMQYIPAL